MKEIGVSFNGTMFKTINLVSIGTPSTKKKKKS